MSRNNDYDMQTDEDVGAPAHDGQGDGGDGTYGVDTPLPDFYAQQVAFHAFDEKTIGLVDVEDVANPIARAELLALRKEAIQTYTIAALLKMIGTKGRNPMAEHAVVTMGKAEAKILADLFSGKNYPDVEKAMVQKFREFWYFFTMSHPDYGGVGEWYGEVADRPSQGDEDAAAVKKFEEEHARIIAKDTEGFLIK
jgi:hypothetical protein